MSGTTTILQFADVHFGVEDPEALRAVEKAEEEFGPDLVLICGDITQTGSMDEFKAARDWVAGFAAPVVSMPGNHDAPYFQPLARIFDPYGRYRKYIAPHCQDAFVDARVAVLPYNSARAIQAKLDWSVGVVNLGELDALLARFDRDAAGRLHFLACHHPMVYPPEAPLDKETQNGPEALRRLSDARADAVLSGHIHVPFVKDREPGQTGLLSIGAGTLSVRRRGYEPSFNLVEVAPDEVRVTAVEVVRGVFQRGAVWRKPREAFA